MKHAGESEDREASRVDVVVAGSRIMAALQRVLEAPALALEGAKARRLLAPFTGLDLAGRVSAAGSVVVVAVVTHVLVLALLRVPVHVLGWSVRGGLIVLGLFLALQPGALAAAWKSKAGELPPSQ